MMNTDLYKTVFDQYQRYQITREIIDKLRKNGKFKILDIGGHHGNIKVFFPEDETFVLDKKRCDVENFIQGDATDLPFEDNSFNIAVSLDVLEHIPPEMREKFISEHLRVSENFVVIGAPFADEDVLLAEEMVMGFIKSKHMYDEQNLQASAFQDIWNNKNPVFEKQNN